jgi:hypothetical protein
MAPHHDRPAPRRLEMVIFDNMVYRSLQVWKDRHYPALRKVFEKLRQMLPFPDTIQDNLIVWYHDGSPEAQAMLNFLRYLQLDMRDEFHYSFTLRIYVKEGSILSKRNKDRRNYRYGDIFYHRDSLVQIIELETPSGEPSEYIARHFGDSQRLYVVLNRRASEVGLEEPITLSTALPEPKRDYDLAGILTLFIGFIL